MWPFRPRSPDSRNVLFDAALEFGENWRRDVASLAAERLPDLTDRDRQRLANEIERTRRATEDWIQRRWDAVNGNWSDADASAAAEFIRAEYPWMDQRNVDHAVSQGTYYAWHG